MTGDTGWFGGLRRRWHALRPGVSVGENANNLDFWGIMFGRPSAFLFLVLFGDVRLVTPNGLTWVSFLMLLAASWLMAFGGPGHWVAAAVLMNLNLTLDCADGQLARYRKISSPFGSYLDKVTDYLGFLAMFAGLAHLCFRLTGEVYYVHLAMLGLFSQVTVGYVKWLAIADRLQKGKPIPAQPFQSWGTGVRWWGRLALKMLEFREPDLFLWVGLALLIGRPEWALWLIAVTQPITLVSAIFFRGWQMTRP